MRVESIEKIEKHTGRKYWVLCIGRHEIRVSKKEVADRVVTAILELSEEGK